MIHNMKPSRIDRITEQDKTLNCNYCSLCSKMATHKAYYELEDDVKEERYCWRHVPILG